MDEQQTNGGEGRQPAVLIVTVGTTDIKFGVQVADNKDCALSGQCFPVGVFKNERALHEKLKNELTSYSFASEQQWQTYAELREQNTLVSNLLPKGFHPDELEVSPTDNGKLFPDSVKPRHQGIDKLKGLTSREVERDYLKNEIGLGLIQPLQLWLVKVMPVALELKKREQYDIKMVVVLGSSREKAQMEQKGLGHMVRGEPVAAAKIVCEWLADFFELKNLQEFPSNREKLEFANQGIALYTHYLHSDMEADGETDNFPINRQAMQIVDDLFRKIQSIAKKQQWKNLKCIYSSGGGFPEHKHQIGAACHLYFSNVDKLVAPQHFDRELKSEDADKYPAPDTTYRAREQVIHLLQSGDYAGAATIASLVQGQIKKEVGDRRLKSHYNYYWSKTVVEVSQWLQGTLAKTDFTEWHPLKALAANNIPYALKVAFRIEAALQQNHIQEAIRYTSDMAEVLIYDYLSKAFNNGDYGYFDNANPLTEAQAKELWYALKISSQIELQPLSVNRPFQIEKVDGNKKKLLKYNADKNEWEPDTQALHSMNWQNVASYLVSQSENGPLFQFKQALRSKIKGGKSPAQYRNDITHKTLNSNQLEKAKNTFVEAGLWTEKEADNLRFLVGSLAQQVLRPLLPDNTDLVNLYQKLWQDTANIIYQAKISNVSKED